MSNPDQQHAPRHPAEAPGDGAATPGAAPIGTGVLDAASEAALRLAADRPWSEVSLRDIARAAGVSFADLYARTPGKPALLHVLSTRLDMLALSAAEDDASGETIDRLFEAVMARLEAMSLHRAALIAIGRSEGPLAMAPHLPRTARTLLESAGVDTGGARGGARVLAMTGVWARVLQVWRDDDGALNRTMAEIDRRLRQMNQRLGRVGAGF